MNTRRCLKIADRIDALLEGELGQGIDFERMLRDPLYARDVLLVCDAFPGHELATLASEFRTAMAEDEPPVGAARSADSDFQASSSDRPGKPPGFISSLFDAFKPSLTGDSIPPAPLDAATKAESQRRGRGLIGRWRR